MPAPKKDEMLARPEWLEDFQAWVSRLSPAILADLIDVLALELRESTSDVATGSFRGYARPTVAARGQRERTRAHASRFNDV